VHFLIICLAFAGSSCNN